MNKSEFAIKLTESIYGKRVQGKVAAVLPKGEGNFDRYVVEVGEEHLDIDVPQAEGHGIFHYVSHVPHPPLNRGDEISVRVRNIRPWVDGQSVETPGEESGIFS